MTQQRHTADWRRTAATNDVVLSCNALDTTDQYDQCPAGWALAAINDAQVTRLATTAAAAAAAVWRCVEVTKRRATGTCCAIVLAAVSDIMWHTSTEMSAHSDSDGSLMESIITARSCATRLNSDKSFYSSGTRSATARRVINRGRSVESTKSYGSGTTAASSARQSLHGRPVGARPGRRDARYRRFQCAVYNFLERPKNWRSILYHLFV